MVPATENFGANANFHLISVASCTATSQPPETTRSNA
jgi:hypothetical protein